MSTRTYGQYCALAKTLDMVGERWTLLVVRELVGGPKRYTDVLEGLPGMNTTLLAQRLRDLEGDGIVRKRRLPPPAASTVYELTELGEELILALVPLLEWGARNALGIRRPEEVFKVEWPLAAFAASIDSARLMGTDATYEFHVDESVGFVTLSDGHISVGSGPAPAPSVTVTTDSETFVAVGTGQLDPQEMIAAGRIAVTGEPAAIAELTAFFVG